MHTQVCGKPSKTNRLKFYSTSLQVLNKQRTVVAAFHQHGPAAIFQAARYSLGSADQGSDQSPWRFCRRCIGKPCKPCTGDTPTAPHAQKDRCVAVHLASRYHTLLCLVIPSLWLANLHAQSSLSNKAAGFRIHIRCAVHGQSTDMKSLLLRVSVAHEYPQVCVGSFIHQRL